MAKRGEARGKPRSTHHLTEAKQGRYHYVYGPYAEPGLRIQPGDVVVAETQHPCEGAIRSERVRRPEVLHMPLLIPQCGPVGGEGPEKGGVLCVPIHSIKPRGAQPVGAAPLSPRFGGLVPPGNEAMLHAALPDR